MTKATPAEGSLERGPSSWDTIFYLTDPADRRNIYIMYRAARDEWLLFFEGRYTVVDEMFAMSSMKKASGLVLDLHSGPRAFTIRSHYNHEQYLTMRTDIERPKWSASWDAREHRVTKDFSVERIRVHQSLQDFVNFIKPKPDPFEEKDSRLRAGDYVVPPRVR